MSQGLEKKIKSRIRIAEHCVEIINNKIIGDCEAAIYRLYFSVFDAMRKMASLPKEKRKPLYTEIRNRNLFPLRLSCKYTPKTINKDIPLKKRMLKEISNYSYTRFGYYSLVLLYYIKSLFSKLSNI